MVAVGLRHQATGQDPNRILSVKGVIAEIMPVGADDPDVEAKLLVEGQMENDPPYNRIVAAITSQTRIRQENNSSWVGTTADLEVGRRVEVWFREPVEAAYPPQVKALAIQLRD
jgi:hypothetical protein